MAKKILFFRNAKWNVIDLLVKQFEASSEVYCFVQDNSADELKQRYPSITGYVLPHDLICYDDFRSISDNRNWEVVYDEVYIPVTGYQFNNLEEIYDILDDLTYHTLYLVNGDGDIVCSKTKERETLLDIICSHSTYMIICIFNKIYYIKQRVLSRRM